MQIATGALLQGPQGSLSNHPTLSHHQPPGAPWRHQEGPEGDKAELPIKKKRPRCLASARIEKSKVNAAT